MSVKVLIITHGDIGKAIMNAVSTTLEGLPLETIAVEVSRHDDPEKLIKRIDRGMEQFQDSDELLILTDMYGSTPGNIARRIGAKRSVRIISGLNLPMLIRVMNYADLSLAELAEKAFTGGRDGVLACDKVSPSS